MTPGEKMVWAAAFAQAIMLYPRYPEKGDMAGPAKLATNIVVHLRVLARAYEVSEEPEALALREMVVGDVTY